MTAGTAIDASAHDEELTALLRADTEFAAQYLTDAIAEGSHEELLIAMRRLACAHGGVRALARDSALNASQLYRTLSAKGNPELRSLTAMLDALGLRLAVVPATKDTRLS